MAQKSLKFLLLTSLLIVVSFPHAPLVDFVALIATPPSVTSDLGYRFYQGSSRNAARISLTRPRSEFNAGERAVDHESNRSIIRGELSGTSIESILQLGGLAPEAVNAGIAHRNQKPISMAADGHLKPVFAQRLFAHEGGTRRAATGVPAA